MLLEEVIEILATVGVAPLPRRTGGGICELVASSIVSVEEREEKQ